MYDARLYCEGLCAKKRVASLQPASLAESAGQAPWACLKRVSRTLGNLRVPEARLLGAALVTRDERILEYGRQGHVRVIDATP